MAKTTQASKVHVTELVLRDGHQCHIATRMRTEDMLPICSKLDAIGFWSLEAWGGATFDACVRYLKEDPWERLKSLRKALPNSRIQMLLRGQNLLGYRHYSDDVVQAFVKKSADNGVDVFRIFDAMNDTRNLKVSIDAVKKAGKHAEGTISYTTSPVHNVAHFVSIAKELEAMGSDTISIKDMAGLLTPQATVDLVKAINAAVNVPIHVHSHATSGLASMNLLRALENGAVMIDTCCAAFSEGASHPTTESMILTGAFDSLHIDVNRRDLLLHFSDLQKSPGMAVSGAQMNLGFEPPALISSGLPAMTPAESVKYEVDRLGIDMSRHMIEFYGDFLNAIGAVRSSDLLKQRSQSSVLVAGIKVAMQTPPVRSGKRVIFVTLDDGYGLSDSTFFTDVQGEYANVLYSTSLLLVRGVTRRTGARGISIRATGAWDLRAAYESWSTKQSTLAI